MQPVCYVDYMIEIVLPYMKFYLFTEHVSEMDLKAFPDFLQIVFQDVGFL